MSSPATERLDGPRRATAGSVFAFWRGLRRLRWWQRGLLIALVAVCALLVVRALVIETALIPSGSMEQTLRVGDQVLVDRTGFTPRRGEIVVFRGTARWQPEGSTGSDYYIKRIVGLPGDVVSCCDRAGRVTVNGRALTEPYVYQNSAVDDPPSPGECRSRRFATYRVPAGDLFVLGDHRRTSQDSRCQGPVPVANVIGRAVAVAWPVNHWRTLPVPGTYRDIPDPS